ncbi:MAG: hypothetical protein WBJ21_12195 [Burkholderiaceae bacterium]|jgi:hypothetical protein
MMNPKKLLVNGGSAVLAQNAFSSWKFTPAGFADAALFPPKQTGEPAIIVFSRACRQFLLKPSLTTLENRPARQPVEAKALQYRLFTNL